MIQISNQKARDIRNLLLYIYYLGSRTLNKRSTDIRFYLKKKLRTKKGEKE